MNVRFKQDTHSNKIILEALVDGFTKQEMDMLTQLKAPVITIQKQYGSNIVKFSKKLKPGFRVRVKFDLSLEDEVDDTLSMIDDFMTDLIDTITDVMAELDGQYSPALAVKEKVVKITY